MNSFKDIKNIKKEVYEYLDQTLPSSEDKEFWRDPNRVEVAIADLLKQKFLEKGIPTHVEYSVENDEIRLFFLFDDPLYNIKLSLSCAEKNVS
jgi:hypothetical protein